MFCKCTRQGGQPAQVIRGKEYHGEKIKEEGGRKSLWGAYGSASRGQLLTICRLIALRKPLTEGAFPHALTVGGLQLTETPTPLQSTEIVVFSLGV